MVTHFIEESRTGLGNCGAARLFVAHDLDPERLVSQQLEVTLLFGVCLDRVFSDRPTPPRALLVPIDVVRALAMKLRLTGN